jgi:plastocyanin
MQLPKVPELAVALAAAGLLVGSAVGLARSPDGPGASAASGEVQIAGFAFGPDVLTVSVGDTVTWSNSDDTTHTVTGDAGDPLDSPNIKGGTTYEVTLEEAGTFEYVCKLHPNMQGTIVVEG